MTALTIAFTDLAAQVKLRNPLSEARPAILALVSVSALALQATTL